MSNLEYLQTANVNEVVNFINNNIDRFIEPAYSTREDEEGLLIANIDKVKFTEWLAQEKAE